MKNSLTLSALKAYLQSKGEVSLGDIVRHFGQDKVSIQTKLMHLIRGKKVAERSFTPRCGKTCNSCSSEITKFYSLVKE